MDTALAGEANLRLFQTKDFVKFLSLVVILYLGQGSINWLLRIVLTDPIGFLTTFVLLARGTYTPSEMVSNSNAAKVHPSLRVHRAGYLSKFSLGHPIWDL